MCCSVNIYLMYSGKSMPEFSFFPHRATEKKREPQSCYHKSAILYRNLVEVCHSLAQGFEPWVKVI